MMGNPFDDYLAFERMMKPIGDYERMMQPVRDFERMMQRIRDYDRMMQSVQDVERMMQPMRDAQRLMRIERDAATLQAWRGADRYMQSSRIAEEAWRQFRQVADARETLVQHEAVSEWQSMRQQQELLSATFAKHKASASSQFSSSSSWAELLRRPTSLIAVHGPRLVSYERRLMRMH